MELDELKKSWHSLDEHLQKEPIANEDQIVELIAKQKANARKNLGRLTGWQRFSISIGIVALAILLIACLLPSVFHVNEEYQPKINSLILFVAVSLLGGIWWDYKTYRWMKHTHIDEMPVMIVSKRMITLRRWTKYEVIAISVWIILFNILNYWAMGYYMGSVTFQAIVITIFIVCDTAIIYFLYKRVVYKYLNDIKKNIEDLEDICND